MKNAVKKPRIQSFNIRNTHIRINSIQTLENNFVRIYKSLYSASDRIVTYTQRYRNTVFADILLFVLLLRLSSSAMQSFWLSYSIKVLFWALFTVGGFLNHYGLKWIIFPSSGKEKHFFASLDRALFKVPARSLFRQCCWGNFLPFYTNILKRCSLDYCGLECCS
jgi:hypothetical protein